MAGSHLASQAVDVNALTAPFARRAATMRDWVMASEVEIVSGIARALNGSVDVGDALDAVLSAVADYLGLTTGWVWLTSGTGYELAAARDLPTGFRRDPCWTSGSCWCQKRFDSGGLVAGSAEQIECSRLDALTAGADGFRYHATLPLVAGDERLGILNVASQDGRALRPRELELLRTVSDMLAVALERARLFERSRAVGIAHERARLSREMHDTLAQSLAALVMHLEAASEQERVDVALQLARKCLDDTRAAMAALRSANHDLRDELMEVVREVRMRFGLRVDASVDVRSQPPARVSLAVSRIIQEALTNVGRHAQTDSARLRVVARADGVRAEVSDSGPGFAMHRAGMGLTGMYERAHLVAGTLTVESGADGTSVTFEWGSL